MTLPDPNAEPTLPVAEAGRIFFNLGRAKSYTEASRYEATGGAEGLPVVRFGRSLRAVTAECRRMCGLDVGDAERGLLNPSERETRPARTDLATPDTRPNRDETERYSPG